MTMRQTETVAVKRQTVLQVCVAQLGVHRGALAAANVAQLAMTTATLGHFPTTDEYCADWVVSERTGWNHRARARAGLGDDWQDVIEQLALVVERKRARTPRAVMNLPAPSSAFAASA